MLEGMSCILLLSLGSANYARASEFVEIEDKHGRDP